MSSQIRGRPLNKPYNVRSCHLTVTLLRALEHRTGRALVRLCGAAGKYWGALSVGSTVAGFIKPESCHPGAHGSSLAVLTVWQQGAVVRIEGTAAPLPTTPTKQIGISQAFLIQLPVYRSYEGTGHKMAGGILCGTNDLVSSPPMSREKEPF